MRWSHLVAPGSTVLDIACGSGRHMRWFAEHGHTITGIDRSPAAIDAAQCFGEGIVADIENDSWPLMNGSQVRQFQAVIVTNYLWRPLFPIIAQSVAMAGVLIYETFADGNELIGKPSNPDFLLRPDELLAVFKNMHVVGFEQGFLDKPDRYVQRIVAVQRDLEATGRRLPKRYQL